MPDDNLTPEEIRFYRARKTRIKNSARKPARPRDFFTIGSN